MTVIPDAPMKRLKDTLRSRALSFGSWLAFPCDATVEIMARAGFAWLVIDMEHAPLGIAEAARMIRIIDLARVPAICRLPGHDPALVKTLLDAGAAGVMFPMIETGEQAAAAVASTRYPPDGTRGVGLGRAHGYGSRFEAYRTGDVTNIVVIAMIESRRGVDNVDAIVRTPGVDGVLIGPYDLSGSLGQIGNLNHDRVVAARKRVIDAARDAAIGCGLHVVHPAADTVGLALAEGYSFIALGVDMVLLERAARGVLELTEGKPV